MTIGDRLSVTYHRDLSGIPSSLDTPSPGLALRYSWHSLRKADARLGESRLPYQLPEQFEVVEVQVWNGTVLKWLLRLPWTADRELILVLSPSGYVRTLWTNDKTDQHATLDTIRYAKATA